MRGSPTSLAARRSRRFVARTLALSTALAMIGSVVPAGAATPAPAADEGNEARGSWQVIKPTNTGIPGDYVYSLAIDDKDRPWVTADDPIWDEGGLGVKKATTWDQWTNVDGKAPTHEMGDVQFDDAGKPWASSPVGLLTLNQGEMRRVWSAANAPWPTSQVRDFDWDSKGNLWVALGEVTTVKGGVARYNGRTWKVWTTENGIPWDEGWDQVTVLEIDDEDNVWIGSPVMGGAMYDGSGWAALGNGEGTWVTDIAIAPDGTPWYAFTAQGVMTWNGTSWIDRTGEWGTDDASLVSIDQNGRVWVGTYIGRIWRWSGTGSSWDLSYEAPSLSHIYALEFDSQNRPYVGGIGGLDVRNANGTWTVHNTLNTALPSRWVDHIMIDSTGDGWFSTAGGGIGAYDGKRWKGYNPYNYGTEPWPFPTDSSTSTAEAPDGTIWASPTNNGVGEWDGARWTAHLPHVAIESVAVDSVGRVYAAPDRGEVQRWNGTRWTGIGNPTGNADLHQIAVDADGNLWLASAIGVLRYDGRRWTTYNETNSDLPANFVTSVTPDPETGAVWVGTYGGGLAKIDGAEWTIFTEADGLVADMVSSIAIAPDGKIWIGAFNASDWPYYGGVSVYDGTRFKSYTTANSPLPHNQVESVAVDADGRVWITTASEGAAILTP